MTDMLIIRGPAVEIRALLADISTNELARQVEIDGPREEKVDLLDGGQLRGSPWLELIISFAAGVGSAATMKAFDALSGLIGKRRRLETKRVSGEEKYPAKEASIDGRDSNED
jgi:hypothetical protein